MSEEELDAILDAMSKRSRELAKEMMSTDTSFNPTPEELEALDGDDLIGKYMDWKIKNFGRTLQRAGQRTAQLQKSAKKRKARAKAARKKNRK